MSKIVFIASQRLPTEKAYGLQIAKMCEAFADSGVSVELLIPTRRNSKGQDMFDYYGVRRNFVVTCVSSPDFYFPGSLDRIAFSIKQLISAFKLVKVALSRNADVIYSRDELPIWLAGFYCNHPKLVFEAHRFSSRRSWLYKKFKNTKVKIVTISNGIKNKFIEFGYGPQSMLVAHDGVDMEEFKNLPDQETERRNLNLPLDKKIVMYIGQLIDWKGVDTLVLSSALLDSNTLIFIGGGTDEDIRRLKKLDTANTVRFEGETSSRRLAGYLKAADVLVLPNKKDGDISEFYTSPLKMFAYMASGKPIVASDLPSLREVLNEKNSLLVEPNDPEALAEGIQKIIREPNLADSLGKQALLDVTPLTWQSRATLIKDFLSLNDRN